MAPASTIRCAPVSENNRAGIKHPERTDMGTRMEQPTVVHKPLVQPKCSNVNDGAEAVPMSWRKRSNGEEK
eukprot:gene3514-14121_t